MRTSWSELQINPCCRFLTSVCLVKLQYQIHSGQILFWEKSQLPVFHDLHFNVEMSGFCASLEAVN